MATYEITSPDGQTYEVTAPDNASEAAVLAYAKTQFSKQSEPQTWGKTATDAVSNIIPSTVGLVKNVASAAMHPIDTASSIVDVAAGGLQNALPKGVVDYINTKFPSESAEEARAKADAVGKFYVDRYGSVEGFKKALGKDPAGVMADVATVLSGGAVLASKAGLTRTGEMLSSASKAVDPLYQTVRAAESAVKPLGHAVSEIVGGMGTHTGGESMRQMANAGVVGGSKGKQAIGFVRDTGSTESFVIPFVDVFALAPPEIATLSTYDLLATCSSSVGVVVGIVGITSNVVDEAKVIGLATD